MNTSFLEFTDKNGRPALVNPRNISSVVIYTEPDEQVHIYLIGDNEAFIRVKESYDEVKRKIASATGGYIY
ncbi:hypothetical protein [Mucilaginibacter lacusdianchii]|uniref:hypothetical protein n=1 Tax=Mucilaginibacter lacusdianchii TaxID=2684211 RepID=UPI00131CA029|nr:hypothetical protein [Mucilaginibacter sp. JXJ CY 39]